MGRLEIVDADLGARNVRGNRQHRHAAAMAIEQAVDEMQIAGTAASGADRELAGQMRLGAGRKRAGLLVAHMHPVDAADPPQRIGEAVQGVADDTIDALDAGLLQRLRHVVGNDPGHRVVSCSYCLRMIFSENRCTLFRIMRPAAGYSAT